MSTTNRKRAARDLAAREGITYQQALTRLLNTPHTTTPLLLDEDWAGRMIDGYTDNDIDTFMSDVLEATGIELVCVWDYYDDYGFGGCSSWYVVERTNDDVTLYELDGDLWKWMCYATDDPDAPATHGDPSTWKGPKANFGDKPPVEWSGHNWPIEDQTMAEVGECDECGEPYECASTHDHCGECGMCFDHCDCEGGPNPHVREILADMNA